jgi:hypothetical protein
MTTIRNKENGPASAATDPDHGSSTEKDTAMNIQANIIKSQLIQAQDVLGRVEGFAMCAMMATHALSRDEMDGLQRVLGLVLDEIGSAKDMLEELSGSDVTMRAA